MTDMERGIPVELELQEKLPAWTNNEVCGYPTGRLVVRVVSYGNSNHTVEMGQVFKLDYRVAAPLQESIDWFYSLPMLSGSTRYTIEDDPDAYVPPLLDVEDYRRIGLIASGAVSPAALKDITRDLFQDLVTTDTHLSQKLQERYPEWWTFYKREYQSRRLTRLLRHTTCALSPWFMNAMWDARVRNLNDEFDCEKRQADDRRTHLSYLWPHIHEMRQLVKEMHEAGWADYWYATMCHVLAQLETQARALQEDVAAYQVLQRLKGAKE